MSYTDGAHYKKPFGWVGDSSSSGSSVVTLEPLIYDNAYEKTSGHGNVHWNDMTVKGNLTTDAALSANSANVTNTLTAFTLEAQDANITGYVNADTVNAEMVTSTTVNAGDVGANFVSVSDTLTAATARVGTSNTPTVVTPFTISGTLATTNDSIHATQNFVGGDGLPGLSFRYANHNDISLNFDTYVKNNTWNSSTSSGGCFRIAKGSGSLTIWAAPNTTVGTSPTMTSAITINSGALVSARLNSSGLEIINATDTTKRLMINTNQIPTATTITLTAPTANGKIVTTSNTGTAGQVLTCTGTDTANWATSIPASVVANTTALLTYTSTGAVAHDFTLRFHRVGHIVTMYIADNETTTHSTVDYVYLTGVIPSGWEPDLDMKTSFTGMATYGASGEQLHIGFSISITGDIKIGLLYSIGDGTPTLSSFPHATSGGYSALLNMGVHHFTWLLPATRW